jgi:hypothetical protein
LAFSVWFIESSSVDEFGDGGLARSVPWKCGPDA